MAFTTRWSGMTPVISFTGDRSTTDTSSTSTPSFVITCFTRSSYSSSMRWSFW